MDQNHKILFFIPVYNCEKQITRVLDKILKIDQKEIFDVIVVNNCSTDKTADEVKKFMTQRKLKNSIKLLMNRHNYGLGGSHKIAYKYAIENKYDYLIVAQGDDQGDPVELYDHLKSELIKNKEINMIMGSRFQDLDRIHGYSKLKILFNLFFSLIGSILFFKKISDLSSGQLVINVNILKEEFYINFSNELWFNYYFSFYFLKNKIPIIFKSISWREEDQISNLKVFKQIYALIKLILLIRLKKNYLEKLSFKNPNYEFEEYYEH